MKNLRVLYHDNCFDGLASAAVFASFYRGKILSGAEIEYEGLTHKAGQLIDESLFGGGENVIVDFKYSASEKLTWWFDHHESAFLSAADELHFRRDQSGRKFHDPAYKSCTKFIAAVTRDTFGFEDQSLDELVHWADIIDGAQFPNAQFAVELKEPAMRLMTVIEATRDADLVELPVDASGRGQYLYFGSDSKLRGLNVVLKTSGSGVAGDAIDWEYWNGTRWADLEAGCPGSCSFGFVDQTASFSRNGTVYWTSDPTGWAAYSLNGGPELFYLRAHLDPSSPGYGTRPRESRITTDILLFQYCGDVTAAGQTFAFSPPVPTAVRIQSFSATPADASVDRSATPSSPRRRLTPTQASCRSCSACTTSSAIRP